MEQDLGNGWSEMVHPDDRDRCWASYSSAFDACRNFQIEYRLRRADGQYRWVLDRGLPRFAPGGVFAGYIGSCMDITELRQAQEEALARQKLESIGVLAGGIAHDFNNLLGTILADAEVAESELSAGSSPTEEIQRIKNVAIRAAEIVRELMIYAGQDEANLELLSISRLMEEMLELLKVSISKRVSLETDLEKDLPAVRGSATQIRQILMNLILNASEAIGQPDGVIKVTTSRVAGYTALALNRGTKLPDGDYVRLEVSDNGCGMTEDTKAKIFDPFFTTKFAGRGLGLAVVQGIIRAHSGAINVISAPGQGTRFQILFPSANKPVAQDRVGDAVSADRIPSNAVTVLVVEDEDTLRLAVSNMLRKKGFCIIEARDGSAAINLLHKHQDGIDVALLDLTIPGNSICEVIAEAGRLRPDIKIILTTAYTRDAVGQCRDAPQVRGFIRKPYRLADLVQLLRRTASS
jgi:signal transduction histidine kinase